jgi:hypothetical protein
VLRPESVALLSHRGAAPAEQVAAPGVVRTRTFLGEKVEYAAEVAGVLVQAVSYDPLHHGLFDVGARVQVSCAPATWGQRATWGASRALTSGSARAIGVGPPTGRTT